MTWPHHQMCSITANLELKHGYYVNLGIGIPTEVANHVPNGVKIALHSENGMLGMGPFPTQKQVDPDLINAGKQTVTELQNSSYFNSADSFAMIRGGHIDLTVLGALQVSADGDLANWCIPGKMVKGMGGAMDLVAGVKRIVVIMDLVAKDGAPKIVKQCTLPLTGKKVVNRIITDHAIFDINNSTLELIQLAPNVTLEEVRAKTGAPFNEVIQNLNLAA